MKLPASFRLVAGVVAIEILMLGLLVWNSIRLTNQSHSELLESTVHEQSALLAAAVAPGLIAYDFAMVEDVLTILNDRYDLVHAEVMDYSGSRIAAIGEPGHEHSEYVESYREIPGEGRIEVNRSIEVEGQSLGILHLGYSTAALRAIIDKVKWQNTAIAIVAILLLIGATILTSMILTVNLRQLKRGAEEIRNGNLEHQIPLSGDDEFSDLARTFNQMARHLHSTQGQLQDEHRALVRQTSHFQTLLNSVDAVIWEADSETAQISFVSDEACELLGYPASQWLEEGFLLHHVHEDDFAALSGSLEKLKKKGGQVSLDLRLMKVNNKPAWARIIASSEYDVNEGRTLIRGLIIDIAEEKQHEEQIVYLADHDSMTGLINRRQFQTRLEHHIAYSKRYNHASSLMFIDVDHFKYINDTFGHQAGDAYLVQVSNCLKGAIRETDILGRLGGDEFGMILPFTAQEEAAEVAENLLRTLSEKDWIYDNERVHITASIGITVLPDGRKLPSQFLAEADAAMYVAKSKGGNAYHIYQKDDHGLVRMQSKVRIENLIHDALARKRFLLHYQPIYDLNSGTVSHYEALIRIQSDDGGLVYPGDFIGTAETFGLIRSIDKWVFEQVVQVISRSLQSGENRTVAFNLSGQHIDDVKFQAWMKAVLVENRDVARHLIIEVTETAAVENLASATDFMETMLNLGCRFALDDFGVGFASFHYIKALPVTYIKIDGSFVRNLHVDEADSVFIKATVDIASRLGITTIAEYVENEHILRMLEEAGVDFGQGFYLGKPCPNFIDDAGPRSTVIPWKGGGGNP